MTTSPPDGSSGAPGDPPAEDAYEHAACGLLTTAANGTIQRVNGTMCAWTGFSASELVGRRFQDLLTIGSKLFHQTPFIWHIWDGRKDGFAALVNYHLLDRGNLDRLIHTYLGDWLREQRAAAGN